MWLKNRFATWSMHWKKKKNVMHPPSDINQSINGAELKNTQPTVSSLFIATTQFSTCPIHSWCMSFIHMYLLYLSVCPPSSYHT